MGSALLETDTEPRQEPSAVAPLQAARTALQDAALSASNGSVRQEAAARLAAHRNRRTHSEAQAQQAVPKQRSGNTRSTRVAAAVAERYAQAQSYRAYLAAEAEKAVRQAQAAAEIAALNARALAEAQQNLLTALSEPVTAAGMETHAGIALEQEPECTAPSLWPELDQPKQEEAGSGPHENAGRRRAKAFQPPASSRSHRETEAVPRPDAAAQASAPMPQAHAVPAADLGSGEGTLTIRLYRDATGTTRVALDPLPAPHSAPSRAAASRRTQPEDATALEEARALDEEIEFRQAPVFEEPAGPPMPLPANLIAFPRQLVATRKARPRLAEGPLREEGQEAPSEGQLRIFEVDPSQIATSPAEEDNTGEVAAQWSSIWLDSRPAAGAPQTADAKTLAAREDNADSTQKLPDVASVGRRVAATAINAGIVSAAAAVFAAVSLLVAGRISAAGAAHSFATWTALRAASPYLACVLLLLGLVYEALFFSFSAATPGMRCVRIALCTFSNENPCRGAARRRLLTLLLSACPLGLGFLWAALDEDKLAWHDRISRIYQRSY